MVRKRKKKEEDEQQPPWCYYCDRVFFDEQTLVQHQKAKHFKVGPSYYYLPPYPPSAVPVNIPSGGACKYIKAPWLIDMTSTFISIVNALLIITQGLLVSKLIQVDAAQCTVCHKRLTSAGGLRVHCHQVHRFALEKCAS